MFPPNRYSLLAAELLHQHFPEPPPAVREPVETYMPVPVSERLVQCIWYDQRLKRDALKLTDGRPVKVIDAGRWNLEAGPDFRQASVQIGDAPPLSGDVEIHLRAADWRDHGHNRDAAYNNVVLHAVMWDDDLERVARTARGDTLPQLVLQPHLDAPLDDLYDSIDSDSYPYAAHDHGGRCEAALRAMPAASISTLLAEAGEERLKAKARRFLRWSRRGGLEQAFYEGFMEALGYKGNKTPFRRLAQRFSLDAVAAHRTKDARETQLRLEAILLGLGGLLPERETKQWDTASKQRAKLLWDYWWKWRDAFSGEILDRGEWHFANLRPANHPQRRLAAAAALLAAHPSPLHAALGVIGSAHEPRVALTELQRWLALSDGDRYWHTHFRLGGKPQPKASALLGPERATEQVLNVVLPVALAQTSASFAEPREHETRDASSFPSSERVLRIFAALPRLPAHSIERYMFPRLFEGRADKPSLLLPSARHQQGLIQIFQDFCLNNTSNCADCQFPELLNRWTQ